MVKICSTTEYPQENTQKYEEHFERFNYPLHIFQKWAIEGIVTGNHVLVTAPTGSGKSLPAEFAIHHFHQKGKKSIYCSPIKSLSNQKFYDFTQKYPHISIGIITGDIRCNPDADVLIMTTEILLNKLYQMKSVHGITAPSNVGSFSFDMDIENELGCVIFDEIHMINDESRGHVWENSIMMLPRHVQMVGLSATLDNPAKFANWLEKRNRDVETAQEEGDCQPIVYLTSKTVRAVPLIHYCFITTNQGIFKAVKDKSVHEEIRAIVNKPHVIQDAKNAFQEPTLVKINKMVRLLETNNIRIKRSHALNQATQYLTENALTPAICYIFSIKNLEVAAHEVTTDLLEFDSKIPYTIARDCEQILRAKIPNFEEYLHLPEYVNLISLLEKGIATHHSKMLPVLREIVEILFARGSIKLLFATESVAIGLNLPVKSCIFTDVYKHDGHTLRILQAHEYTQAAGRAGRLGLDTVGHVFHLNNLFRQVDSISYKIMMNGKPQTLKSKFRISYNLLLNLMEIGDDDFLSFSNQSMLTTDVRSQVNEYTAQADEVKRDLSNLRTCITYLKTPVQDMEEFRSLQNGLKTAVNKKRKEIERKIAQIQGLYPTVLKDSEVLMRLQTKEDELLSLQKQAYDVNSYADISVRKTLDVLRENDCIQEVDSGNLVLSRKGRIAAQLKETHCLVFAQLIEENAFDHLSSVQLIAFFSCFTNISVQEDIKDMEPHTNDLHLKELVNRVAEEYLSFQDRETAQNITTGFDYSVLHFDIIEYAREWCECENVESCKDLLQKMGEEKQIFLGDFSKALLKINNIACELEKVCELTGNIELMGKLREIPGKTLKYVVTNQSLYI